MKLCNGGLFRNGGSVAKLQMYLGFFSVDCMFVSVAKDVLLAVSVYLSSLSNVSVEDIIYYSSTCCHYTGH